MPKHKVFKVSGVWYGQCAHCPSVVHASSFSQPLVYHMIEVHMRLSHRALLSQTLTVAQR